MAEKLVGDGDMLGLKDCDCFLEREQRLKIKVHR